MSTEDPITVRWVGRMFVMREVTEDNAVELAEWLRDTALSFTPLPQVAAHPLVSYIGSKPGLVANVQLGYAEPLEPGTLIGWGWPRPIVDGDMVAPTLVVMPKHYVEGGPRREQGFEEVSI